MGEVAGTAVRAPRIMIKCDKSDGPELQWGNIISDWFSGAHIDGANPIAPDWKVMNILPDTGVNCTRETGSRTAWTQHVSGSPPRVTIPGQLQSCGPQYNWITPKDAAEYLRLLLGRCRRSGRAGGRIDVVPNELGSVNMITLWWWNPELQMGREFESA
ncbi:hypothetical protein EX30DRAFT_343141 [Ascodesmis nigricans]|uniref:Uncharacterized protein n=1 Tax=Ascodesmis nigricans TaxID=341454 RepID=A0A4V3SI35_9PEZI|nr:hypothetical protein EX30DRAFT_343141 [Ascodesmis nigricans]